MPCYYKDDTVLKVIARDIEENVGPAGLVGKDDERWRELSDAV